MAYATQNDIAPGRMTVVQLGQITSDDGSGTVVDDIVTEKLSVASGVVENYCRERYAIPLKQTNVLTGITVDIAVYELYKRRPAKMPEAVRTAYQDAMALLKDISAGKAALDQPVDGVDQSPPSTVVSAEHRHVFTDRNMKGFA